MPTNLVRGVCAIDLCTYLPDVETLIVSDLHFGFEEYLERQGSLILRFQLSDIVKRIDWIFSQVPIKRVILNGDVKHEFGRIGKQEWRDVTRFIEFLKEKRVEIIAIKGNHDTCFGPLAEKLRIKEVQELRHKNILIVHGDVIPKELLPIIIIGHEHPAITLQEGSKREKYKCFVKTRFKNSVVIAQPSCNLLTQGTDVLQEKLLSPLLAQIARAKVFIVDDKTHDVLSFGKLNGLRRV